MLLCVSSYVENLGTKIMWIGRFWIWKGHFCIVCHKVGTHGPPFWIPWFLYPCVLYCIVLYCIVLCCIVLYCVVLYCTVLFWYCCVLALYFRFPACECIILCCFSWVFSSELYCQLLRFVLIIAFTKLDDIVLYYMWGIVYDVLWIFTKILFIDFLFQPLSGWGWSCWNIPLQCLQWHCQ